MKLESLVTELNEIRLKLFVDLVWDLDEKFRNNEISEHNHSVISKALEDLGREFRANSHRASDIINSLETLGITEMEA